MSYDIVRSIAIKDNKVFFTSAASNVSPRTFERYEVPGYSEIYQKQGMKALLQEIAKNVWNGNYRLQGGSAIARLLGEGHMLLRDESSLARFLDEGHASEFMANLAVRRMDDPEPGAHNTWIATELTRLEGLRHDKSAVLDICKVKPDAFSYAAKEVYNDRDTAKEYIRECSHMLLFTFPLKYHNDKELALLALPHNGCIYRQLDVPLRADKDIIRLAFCTNIPDRRYSEHLPDLIPSEIRKDKEFMRELLEICPVLHVHRTPDILSDLESAKTMAKHNRWAITNLSRVPTEHLRNKELQAVLLERYQEPGDHDRLQKFFQEMSIPLHDDVKPSLEDRITGAQARAGEGRGDKPQKDKDIGRESL